MAGYVGRVMLTAAVAGDVFASPPTEAVLAAIRAVTQSAGALIIVMNYTGDASCARLCPAPLGSLCHILASPHVEQMHSLPGMSLLRRCGMHGGHLRKGSRQLMVTPDMFHIRGKAADMQLVMHRRQIELWTGSGTGQV